MSKKQPVKEYDEVTGLNDFLLPLISSIIDKELFIKSVRIGIGQYGEYLVVMLENNEEFRTNSKVLIDQAKIIQKTLDQGILIRAMITKEPGEEGDYFTFKKAPKGK